MARQPGRRRGVPLTAVLAPARLGASDDQGDRDLPTRIWAELLAEDRPRYERRLAVALGPQEEYLTDTEHQLYRAGKQLRPLLLLLTARLVHGPSELPDKALDGAVSLEMLHVATLIHDDIVDDSLLRRGLPSVNAARGGATAVLVGDLQFVQAIRGFVEAIDHTRDMDLVKLVLDTAFRVCCGELDELATDPTAPTDELVTRYWRTIERKTAVLLGLACEAGAALAGGRTRESRRLGFYGRRVGRAFQIMDDLFDLARADAAAGKPRGMDLVRRRPSLPLVLAAEELGPAHRVTRVLRGAHLEEGELPDLLDEVCATAAFGRSWALAREQALDALEYLRPFPASCYRRALQDLALYVVDRAP